jgi:hypothetical protein
MSRYPTFPKAAARVIRCTIRCFRPAFVAFSVYLSFGKVGDPSLAIIPDLAIIWLLYCIRLQHVRKEVSV